MAAEITATTKLERTKNTSQAAFTPEQLLDLREKGRPQNKTFPMPDDPEMPNLDSDSEEEEWTRGIYASSNASTDCEGSDDEAEKKHTGKKETTGYDGNNIRVHANDRKGQRQHETKSQKAPTDDQRIHCQKCRIGRNAR